MRLIRFGARGFRSLLDVKPVNISKLSLITGQNDGGKSSLLNSIEIFLSPRLKPADDDYCKVDDNVSFYYAVFDATFLLSPEEKEKISHPWDELHICKVCTREGAPDERPPEPFYVYETEVFPDERFLVDLQTQNIEVLRKIVDDYRIPFVGNRTMKEPLLSAIRQWLEAQPKVRGHKIAGDALFRLFPSPIPFQSTLALNPKSEVYSTLRTFFLKKINEKQYSDSLSKISDDIKGEMKAELDQFETIVKSYCNDVQSIEIEPSFDFSSGFKTSDLLIRKKDNIPINLDKEGDGRKRRITLATHEWRKNILTSTPDVNDGIAKNYLIMYDEPDTHLDYHSQRQILDIIRNIATKDWNSVLISTHSLNLIDRIPITDIVHLSLKGNETTANVLCTTDPKLIDSFLYGINDNMGLKNSLLLNEKCFYIVEGETEFNALPGMFLQYKGMPFQSAGIRLIQGHGCGSVRDFAKFLKENHREVVFLLDTDARTKGSHVFSEECLTEDGFDCASQLTLIGDVEFEDAFSDDFYARLCNLHFRKQDGSDWSPTDFMRLRAGDFANGLKAMLSRETRSGVSKPDIGMAIGKTIAVADIPSAITTSFEQAFGKTF
jgi:putative ATP-dependent endonuclease of OLD family